MRIHTQKFARLIVFCFMVLILACSASDADNAEKENKDIAKQDYIARINGTDISQAEFDKQFNLVKQQHTNMGMPLNDEKLKEYKKNILDGLIEQELLIQESIKQGIIVNPEIVQTELDNFKKQFKSEKEFQKKLTEMNYSEKMVRAQIKRTKTMRQLIDEKILPSITIADEEAKSYYDTHPDEFKQPERVRASHILVKVGPTSTDTEKADARKKIQDIKSKLDNGEDFAKLATANSDCPSSKNGGELGTFSRGQMVKPFEDSAFSLKPGEVSDIVETRFGFHIIKSEEKEVAKTLAYNDVKENLKNKLQHDKLKEMMPTYIDSLKEIWQGKVGAT